MIIDFWPIKKIKFYLIFCLAFGGFFVFGSQVNAWTEPTAGPPGGNVAAPINVSSSLQTKIGPLNLGGGSLNTVGILKLFPGSAQPVPCETGQIYYDSGDGNFKYCNNTNVWSDLAGGASGDFLKLYDESQEGWAFIKGISAKTYAFKAESFNNTANEYYGLWGVATADSPESVGVLGQAAGASAYAGYFIGNVKIREGLGTTKLRLGTGVELCFGEDDSDCSSTWGTVTGTGYWSQNPADTYLTNTSSNLALGGTSSANADFYVNTVNQGSVIIGQPSELSVPPSVAFTCGDGACNGSESSNPAETTIYCDIDCPAFVDNISVTFPTTTSAKISWRVNDYVVEAYVDYGPDTNYGSKATVTTGLPTTTSPANLSLTLGSLTAGQNYYYRIVTRDNEDHYSYNTGSFKILTYTCPNTVCEVSSGETCAICQTDCQYLLGSSAGCATGTWCCPGVISGSCKTCCPNTHYGCGALWCNTSLVCVECLSNSNCLATKGFGWICCSGVCIHDTSCDTGGGCFPAGTPIWLDDGTQKPIEEIKAGDKVYSYEDGQLKAAEVSKTFIHGSQEPYYAITLADGRKLKVTGEHPVFNGQSYVKVETLKKGGTLFVKEGQALKPSRIIDISRIYQSLSVYNIEVDTLHNYFAEGILVHNKDPQQDE